MSRWKAILSLLCLATWLPATQHCRLEKVPALSFLQCAADSEGQSDCEGDSCDVIERGVYKTTDSNDVAAAVLCELVFDFAPALMVEPADKDSPARLIPEDWPLLPEAWQSYSVLAVPIRGPSLLS